MYFQPSKFKAYCLKLFRPLKKRFTSHETLPLRRAPEYRAYQHNPLKCFHIKSGSRIGKGFKANKITRTLR